MTSNYFGKNYAQNGGALYFKEAKDVVNKENRNITLNNNIFLYNIGVYYGGAIYSEYSRLYLATTKNNELSDNVAGITGGAAFAPSQVDKNLFDMSDWKMTDNMIDGFLNITNNYTSEPNYIKLNSTSITPSSKIYSGDFVSLRFSLYDEYNNTFNDLNGYYYIELKISLIEKNTKDSSYSIEDNSNFKLSGNTCTFFEGKISL